MHALAKDSEQYERSPWEAISCCSLRNRHSSQGALIRERLCRAWLALSFVVSDRGEALSMALSKEAADTIRRHLESLARIFSQISGAVDGFPFAERSGLASAPVLRSHRETWSIMGSLVLSSSL